MEKKKINVGNLITNYLLVLIVIVIFAVLAFLLPESFPTYSNIMQFLKESCIYCIIILGVTWVFSLGEMDISFGDIAAFSCTCCAALMVAGVPADIAALITIVISAVYGLISGGLVTGFKLNSLIVTIAVSGIAKAVGLIIGKGTNISIPKDEGALLYQLTQADIGGIPVLLIVTVAIIAVLVVIQEKTKFGQYIYAIGDNKVAAEQAGIATKKITMVVFLLAAVFASFGGVLMMFKMSSGQPQLGSSLFLNSYTKIFLGALLAKLGKTNMVGTFVGAVLMSMLSNGLTQLGTPSYVSQIITGVLLVVGVAITSIVQKKRENLLKLGD